MPHAHDPIMYSARFVCARIDNTVEKGNLRTKHTHTCTLMPHAHDPIMYSACFVCARIDNTAEKEI